MDLKKIIYVLIGLLVVCVALYFVFDSKENKVISSTNNNEDLNEEIDINEETNNNVVDNNYNNQEDYNSNITQLDDTITNPQNEEPVIDEQPIGNSNNSTQAVLGDTCRGREEGLVVEDSIVPGRMLICKYVNEENIKRKWVEN